MYTIRFLPTPLWATLDLVILAEYKLPTEEPIILLVLTLRFVTLQSKPNQSKHLKFCDLFLYSQHLFCQLTSEKKKYKMLFNDWVACKSRYSLALVYWVCGAKCWGGHLFSQLKVKKTLLDKLQQHVVTTPHSDKLLSVLENFGKIFVSATEFCHPNKSQKTNQTECDFLRQQNSLVHTKQFAAALSYCN